MHTGDAEGREDSAEDRAKAVRHIMKGHLLVHTSHYSVMRGVRLCAADRYLTADYNKET